MNPVAFAITNDFADFFPELRVNGLWTPADGPVSIRAENDARASGYPQDSAEPLSWLNGACIALDPDDDSVAVSVSTGDPRGGFVMSLRRIPAGTFMNAGCIVMHVPHPEASMLHETLTPIHDGTYMVGGTA
jgi:hypothetical protein